MLRLRSFALVQRLAWRRPRDLTVAAADALAFPRPEQVDALAAGIAANGVNRALLRMHRGWIGLYAAVGLVVVALGPVVPALVGSVADRLRGGSVPGALIGVTIGAVALAAVARWLSTWVVRGLVYQMSHALKLAVFGRLQVVRPLWLATEGRSASTYLMTAPMQLAQLAFVAQFLVNAVLVVVLLGYLVAVFGVTGVVVAVLTGLIVAGWHRLTGRRAARMHRYIEHGHLRIALVDTVTRHWQSIGRQQWEAPVLEGTDRARSGQFEALRTSARSGALLGAIGGGVTPFVCLVALAVFGRLSDGRLGSGLALLLVVQLLITALRENVETYGSVSWAATMARDVEVLFREAPLVEPAPLAAAAGSVRFGAVTLRPGARVALLGADDDVRRVLNALTGATGPAPDLAAVAGTVTTVARGEPELDGSIAANVTLWTTPDPARYAEAVDRSGLRAALDRHGDADGAALGTGQRRLSDGESARLGIARAWYQASDVLVLDDVLSALDPATAATVADGVFGTAAGPTRISAGTRADPAAWAEHIVLCGAGQPAVLDRAAATEQAIATVLPAGEAARWSAALAAPPRTAPTIATTPPTRPAVEPAPVLAGVEVETDVAAARLRDSAAHLAGLFARPVLAVLGLIVAALVVVDLATAGILGRSTVSVRALALLAVAGAVLSGLHRAVVVLGPLTATRALHHQILGRILRRGLPAGSATTAGRFTEDFTTLELYSPTILVGGVQAVVATVVSVAAMALATPVVLVGVATLVVLAASSYPRLRRGSVRGRALLAATRGPVRTFGGAVLGSRTFALSSGLRPAFARRYRDLVAMEHVAIYAAHGARMAVIGAVEAAGVALFAATVVAAALAPVGLAGLIAVAVYASYAIGQRFAALVEAHTEVDSTTQVLGRVSDLLAERALPRQRDIRRGPSTAAGVLDWLAPDLGSDFATGQGLVAENLVTTVPGRTVEPLSMAVRSGEFAAVRGGSGAGKSVLLRTLAGFAPIADGAVLVAGLPPAPYERGGRAVLRLVENDPPPLPIPLAQVCGPDAAALAARWSAELGIAPADPDRQVGALEPAQRQIVALATACTAEPEVLLIDETTSTLDPARERRLLGLVRTRLPAAAIVAVLHRGDNVDLADVEITVRRASRGG